MTDEQINAAIAEACGWREVWRHQDASETASFVGTSPDNKFLPVTNYCNDLNAMHEAEKALKEKRNHYIDTLGMMYKDSWEFATATARQRAEAFLRTLGKWNESTAEILLKARKFMDENGI
jgi:hypothetical protein